MTSGTDLTPRGSRSVWRRTPAVPGRWSRRRRVVSIFAALAAAGMFGGALAPLGSSLAVAQEKPAEVVSLWAQSRGDAQALAASDQEQIAPVTLDRSGYTVYVTPKPTPTPTPSATAGEDGASSSGSAPVRYSGGGSSSDWLAAAGIAEGDWGFVDYIVSRESGWNPNATNASSGACGLVQAYPCSKVPGSGYDPVDNLKWADGYATGRYGSWSAAHAFWTANHWW